MNVRRRAATLGVVLTLVTGHALPVASQDDDDPADLAATTYVRGTLGAPTGGVRGQIIRGDGVVERRGWVFEGGTIETSDPRLSGLVTVTASGDERWTSDGRGRVVLEAARWHIDAGDGSWRGPGTALEYRGEGQEVDLFTVLLTGAGAYEGLSAYLHIDQTVNPIAVEGTVFAGELVPLPESTLSD